MRRQVPSIDSASDRQTLQDKRSKDAVTSGGEGKETTRIEASRDGKRPDGHKPASNKNLS